MAFDGSTWPGFKPSAKPPSRGRPIPALYQPGKKKRPGATTFGPPKQWPKKFGKKKPKVPPVRWKPGFVGPLIPPALLGGAIGIPTGDQLANWYFSPQSARDLQITLPAGWTQATSCPGSPAYQQGTYSFGSCTNSNPGCLTNQAADPNRKLTKKATPGVALETQNLGFPFSCSATFARRIVIMDARCVVGDTCDPIDGVNSRFLYRQIWFTAPGQNVASTYKYWPQRKARGMIPYHTPIALPDPSLDPWVKPWEPWPDYGEPFPQPAPVPSPGPAPGLLPPEPTPHPNPGWITLPLPGNIPMPVPDALPDPVPPPGSPPYIVPALSLDWQLGTQTQLSPKKSAGHAKVKTGTKEREVKINGGRLAWMFKGAIQVVTETNDLVDALFDSVNWAAKLEAGALYRRMTLQDKLSFLWSNYHLINSREFVKNFLYNAVEDWSYGFLGQGVRDFNRKSKNAGFKGGALGGGQTGKRTGDAERPPWLDAFAEFLETSIGSDVEWQMASGKASWKTARQTYGLRQEGGGPLARLGQHKRKRVNKRWKRWSKG